MQDFSPQQAADRRLLESVARGDTKAFSALYDRLAGPLYTLCLRMTGEALEAEDILQEVCLLIWRRAPNYDPAKSSVFGWAAHLTRCKVIDHLRSRGRRLRVVMPMHDAEGQNGGMNSVANVQVEKAAAGGNSVPEQADLNEQAGRIRRLLSELPAEQLQVIELAFFSDLSHYEISARLGQPLGTIKARIRRGLLKLRDALKKVQ